MTWCVSGCQGERASVLPICEHHCLSWQHHEVSSVTFLPRWRLFVWRFIVGFKCLWLLYQALILWAKSLMSSVVVFAPCSPDYNVEFFRNFQLVMNALDNRGMVYLADLCRSEWTLPSKMCLFCCPCSGQESRQQNVFGCRHSPHWERHGWLSGTSHGYQEGKDLLLNQLFFYTFWYIYFNVMLLAFTSISKMQGQTECYECQPKPTQKTFPGCTIRNTPSEPIHCIVWAKYLFK